MSECGGGDRSQFGRGRASLLMMSALGAHLGIVTAEGRGCLCLCAYAYASLSASPCMVSVSLCVACVHCRSIVCRREEEVRREDGGVVQFSSCQCQAVGLRGSLGAAGAYACGCYGLWLWVAWVRPVVWSGGGAGKLVVVVVVTEDGRTRAGKKKRMQRPATLETLTSTLTSNSNSNVYACPGGAKSKSATICGYEAKLYYCTIVARCLLRRASCIMRHRIAIMPSYISTSSPLHYFALALGHWAHMHIVSFSQHCSHLGASTTPPRRDWRQAL